MNTSILLLILVLIGIGSYLLGSRRAVALSGGRPSSMHSRAGYHGSYAVVWAVLPAALILCIWLVISPLIVTSAVRGEFPEDVRSQSEAQQSLTYGMVTSIARGLQRLTPEETAKVDADTAAVRSLLASKGVAIVGEPQRFMVDAAQTLNAMTSTSRLGMIATVLLAAFAGAAYALRSIAPRFRARNRVERVILAALVVASSIAILTTIGIVLSMLSEAIQFFTMVPAHQFFFGTVWDPRFAAAGATDSSGQFGLIPLLMRHALYRFRRHAGRRSGRAVFGDLYVGICDAAPSLDCKAAARGARGHPDNRLRLLRADDRWSFPARHFHTDQRSCDRQLRQLHPGAERHHRRISSWASC